MPFFPIWASVIERLGTPRTDHLAVLDLEVVDGRLHLRRGDLERLTAGVLRRLHHRGADRVDRLAARAEPGERRAVGVPGRDAHLVDVHPEGGRGDLRQRDVRAGDVDLAGEDLSEPSGLSRTVAPVGWSPGIQPPDRQPRAAQPVAVLAAAGRPLRAGLPERVLGEPAQHLLRPVALPRLAVGHRIALLHEVPEPELDRIEPEPAGDLLHVGVDGEDGLGRGGRPVGGDARLVRQHLEAADVEARPLVEAPEEHRAHRQDGARDRAGVQDGLRLQRHQGAVPLDARS